MNGRLETFCDGVFAIAITLLILEIKIPPLDSVHSVEDVWIAIGRLWPSFFALILSFIIIFIGWIGHHNLLKGIGKTSALFQYANAFLMFSIILIPFPTSLIAEYLNTPYSQPAIMIYSLNSLLHNIAWLVLFYSVEKPISLLKDAKAKEIHQKAFRTTKYGSILYVLITLLAWWFPKVALFITVMSWGFWLFIGTKMKYSESDN